MRVICFDYFFPTKDGVFVQRNLHYYNPLTVIFCWNYPKLLKFYPDVVAVWKIKKLKDFFDLPENQYFKP